jgi:hypothetical protein
LFLKAAALVAIRAQRQSYAVAGNLRIAADWKRQALEKVRRRKAKDLPEYRRVRHRQLGRRSLALVACSSVAIW